MNRAAAMQYLYSVTVNPPEDIDKHLNTFFENMPLPEDDETEDTVPEPVQSGFYEFGRELAFGAISHLEQVDQRIKELAVNWSFERIARVDLAILRLAIFELLFRRDIPPIVSINEAIDLSKEYSTPDSKRFINGILDKIKETLDRPLRTPATN